MHLGVDFGEAARARAQIIEKRLYIDQLLTPFGPHNFGFPQYFLQIYASVYARRGHLLFVILRTSAHGDIVEEGRS